MTYRRPRRRRGRSRHHRAQAQLPPRPRHLPRSPPPRRGGHHLARRYLEDARRLRHAPPSPPVGPAPLHPSEERPSLRLPKERSCAPSSAPQNRAVRELLATQMAPAEPASAPALGPRSTPHPEPRLATDPSAPWPDSSPRRLPGSTSVGAYPVGSYPRALRDTQSTPRSRPAGALALGPRSNAHDLDGSRMLRARHQITSYVP